MGCPCVGRREKASADCESTSDTIRTLSRPVLSLYRLKKLLQRSDTGTLYRAEFRPTKQLCFLKAIPKKQKREKQSVILSLEAERLLRLDHPNVLKTLDVMQDDRHFYYVSESFSARLGDSMHSFSSETTAAELLQQVFRALNYCHQQGVTHKRVALESIVLTRCGVKLTNFGLLDTCSPSKSLIDASHFCAPEVGRGSNEKSDVWSCGVVLYALLSGESPFNCSQMSIAQQKSRKQNVRFSSASWDLRSEEVMAFIVSMLDINPQARPSAAQCLSNPWMKLCLPSPTVPLKAVLKCVRCLRIAQHRNPIKQCVLNFSLRTVMHDPRARKFTEVFHVLDKDADGVLCEEELLAALRCCMPEATADCCARKMLRHDKRNVSYSEFLEMCYGEKRLLSHAQSVFSGTVNSMELIETLCTQKSAKQAWSNLCAEQLQTLRFASVLSLASD